MKVGLRTKLLVPTIGVVILSMALSSYFSARKASDQLWDELLNTATLLVNNLSESLSMYSGSLTGVVEIARENEHLKAVLTQGSPEETASATAALKALGRFDDSIQGVNLLDKEGNVVCSSDPSSKGNFSDREYFKLAMAGETNISKPVISRITGKPVFMAATPVRVEGNTVGVLYVRVDLGKFTEKMITPVKVGQNGYAYLVDRSGVYCAHPDTGLILKGGIAEQDWGKKMLATRSGTLEYSSEGELKTAIYTTEKTTGWLVAITVNDSDIAEAAGTVRTASLLAGASGILLVSAAIIIVLSQMLKALGACVGYAEAVAEGDLQRDLSVRRDDELGSLAHSLRAMVESLRRMIETANRQTEEAKRQTELAHQAGEEAQQARARAESAKAEGLLQAAQRLQGVVEIVTSASRQLSAQIEESGRGASTQAQRMGETAASMEEMNATVLEVARNASNASQTTDSARKMAQQGRTAVGDVIQAMTSVERHAQGLKANMDKLGTQAEGIGRIMGVISDIADQTNLLALNAAIEAARAGDAGRGFAVVADEVRKLAEKTMTATKEVGEAIQGIQQVTRLNVGNVEETVGTVEEATKLAGNSGASLEEIVKLVVSASDQVRSIATAAEQQSAASEEISRSMEEVNTISTETSHAMTEAAKAVAELARQSQALQTLIAELEREGGRREG